MQRNRSRSHPRPGSNAIGGPRSGRSTIRRASPEPLAATLICSTCAVQPPLEHSCGPRRQSCAHIVVCEAAQVFRAGRIRQNERTKPAESDAAKLRQLTDRWNEYVLDQCAVIGIATIVPRCVMAQRVHGVYYDMFTSLNASGASLDS